MGLQLQLNSGPEITHDLAKSWGVFEPTNSDILPDSDLDIHVNSCGILPFPGWNPGAGIGRHGYYSKVRNTTIGTHLYSRYYPGLAQDLRSSTPHSSYGFKTYSAFHTHVDIYGTPTCSAQDHKEDTYSLGCFVNVRNRRLTAQQCSIDCTGFAQIPGTGPTNSTTPPHSDPCAHANSYEISQFPR